MKLSITLSTNPRQTLTKNMDKILKIIILIQIIMIAKYNLTSRTIKTSKINLLICVDKTNIFFQK